MFSQNPDPFEAKGRELVMITATNRLDWLNIDIKKCVAQGRLRFVVQMVQYVSVCSHAMQQLTLYKLHMCLIGQNVCCGKGLYGVFPLTWDKYLLFKTFFFLHTTAAKGLYSVYLKAEYKPNLKSVVADSSFKCSCIEMRTLFQKIYINWMWVKGFSWKVCLNE